MAETARRHWPMAGLAHRALLEQVAVVFPVKRDGPALEYRWRFSDGSCGPWFAVDGRPEISAPPAATGCEWRTPVAGI